MIIRKLLSRLRGGPSCHEVMEVLQSYLDGEVDSETARRVAVHLESCADCELESDVYHRIKQSLADAAAPVDPVVMASLRAFSERLVTGDIDS